MDRLVKVIDHNGVATVYEYDSLGNRTKVKHEGGLTVSYKYDVCSRLINEIVTDKDSNVLMFYDYSYGKAGEKTKAVEITRESSESTTVRVIKNEYKYDELLRLTEEKISINDSVDFDDVINIDSENITLATDTITYQGTIENKYAYDKVSNRISKQVNEEEKVFYLNDTYTSLTQVALELTKNTDNTYKVNKYYTRGLELISADIKEDVLEDIQPDVQENVQADVQADVQEDATGNTTENTTKTYCHKIYVQDGHGSVTTLVENSKITDTYIYDFYGILLKKTGDTDNGGYSSLPMN